MAADTVGKALKLGTGLAIAWSIILIICGIIALCLPVMAGISAAIVLAILIIVAGLVHLTIGPLSGSLGSYLWRTLVGIVYIVGGIWMFMHPILGLISFTFVLGILFAIEGFLAIIGFFQVRKTSGSGWVLFDGIITLLLAFFILAHWPSSAAWAVATIVGVNLIISGVTRLMTLLAIRRFLNTAA